MNYLALLLPTVLIIGLVTGLVVLKRRLFVDEKLPAPMPIPDYPAGQPAKPDVPAPAPYRIASDQQGNELTMAPARLYPTSPLTSTQKSIFSQLIKALPGYVVLPKITYDHFLEAKDGSASENTSLRKRAGQHLADFLVCNRKLRVLLVCQIEDGSQLPARVQERERMLQKAGLRLLRWNVEQPPEAAALLNTVQTLEKMTVRNNDATH